MPAAASPALRVKTAAEVEGVVGEEALEVQSVGKQLRSGRAGHGPPVVERIGYMPRVQNLVQCLNVRLHARTRDHTLVITAG